MTSKSRDGTSAPEVATRVLAGAVLAADFCAVQQLMNPKSKLRLAIERDAPALVAREAARVALDPEALDEPARDEYGKTLDGIQERYGNEISQSPFEPPSALVEELAERAIQRQAYASASAALEHLGARNKRVGELTASGLRDLKSAEAADAGATEKAFGSAVESFWLAVKLKAPLEPLFQKRATDLHFTHPSSKERLLGTLLAADHKAAFGLSVEYLLGDKEISASILSALSRGTGRKAFLLELARMLSGGPERYGEFVSRYRASVETLLGRAERPDFVLAQRKLSGHTGEDAEDGINLLRALAVAHPVSALVCRVVAIPRQGHYLIPSIAEGKSALEILGIDSAGESATRRPGD